MPTRAVPRNGGIRILRLSPLFLLSISILLTGCSTNGVNAGSPGGGGKGGKKGGFGGDVPVTVAVVTQKTVPVEQNVIGNVEAYSTISVKAQVGGELTNVYFNEGDFVKKGDLLFNIDPRPFQAALDSAVATVAKDEAVLGQAKANLARDKANLRYQQATASRYAELFKGGIISKDQSEQLSASPPGPTRLSSPTKPFRPARTERSYTSSGRTAQSRCDL
jgi:multidrug efflux system membrane fusion protein